MLEYFKFKNVQDLYYRVAIGTIDNKKLKGFAKSHQNTLLNFFKRKVKNKEYLSDKNNIGFTERFDQIVFGKEKNNSLIASPTVVAQFLVILFLDL